MRDLLEWVMSHLYLVIVIGFALLSMLGKKNKKAGSGQNRMPTFGGEQRERPVREAEPAQPVFPTLQTEVQREFHESRPADEPAYPTTDKSLTHMDTESSWIEHEENSLGQKAEEDTEGYEAAEIISLQRKLAQLERKNRALVRELKRKDTTADQEFGHVHQTSSGPDLGSTTLADGIVWSEILGPPRSKRPYMYKK